MYSALQCDGCVDRICWNHDNIYACKHVFIEIMEYFMLFIDPPPDEHLDTPDGIISKKSLCIYLPMYSGGVFINMGAVIVYI